MPGSPIFPGDTQPCTVDRDCRKQHRRFQTSGFDRLERFDGKPVSVVDAQCSDLEEPHAVILFAPAGKNMILKTVDTDMAGCRPTESHRFGETILAQYSGENGCILLKGQYETITAYGIDGWFICLATTADQQRRGESFPD
jgi:hypothetical protein